MKKKQWRIIYVIGGLASAGLAVALILTALNDSIVLFFSPSDIAEKGVEDGQVFRLGGMVAEGSFKRSDGLHVTFDVTDFDKTVSVTYDGVLPDLFREGQGVVAQGTLAPDGMFHAVQVLAKHDETYMPPEVADALKRAGTEGMVKDTGKSLLTQ